MYKAFFGEGDTSLVNEFASNDKELTNNNFLDSPAEFYAKFIQTGHKTISSVMNIYICYIKRPDNRENDLTIVKNIVPFQPILAKIAI